MTQLQPGAQQRAGKGGSDGKEKGKGRIKKNTDGAFVKLPHLIIYKLCCTAEKNL